jgi:hypothetical protein
MVSLLELMVIRLWLVASGAGLLCKGRPFCWQAVVLRIAAAGGILPDESKVGLAALARGWGGFCLVGCVGVA